MPKSFKRSDRVSSTIQSVVSELLTRDVRDPRVSGVVITRVRMNDDLRLATVLFRVLGVESEKDPRVKLATDGLENAKGFLRTAVGRNLGIKFTPDLRFYFDTSIEDETRIFDILSKVLPKDS